MTHVRFALRHVRLPGADGCLGFPDRHLIASRIDLHERLARRDRLVVRDVDLGDLTGDDRSHRDLIGPQVCVVGTYDKATVPVPVEAVPGTAYYGEEANGCKHVTAALL